MYILRTKLKVQLYWTRACGCNTVIYSITRSLRITSRLFITGSSRGKCLDLIVQPINKAHKICPYVARGWSIAREATWQAFFHHRCNGSCLWLILWIIFIFAFYMQILCRSKPLGTKQHCCATSTGGLDVCSIAGIDLSGALSKCHGADASPRDRESFSAKFRARCAWYAGERISSTTSTKIDSIFAVCECLSIRPKFHSSNN